MRRTSRSWFRRRSDPALLDSCGQSIATSRQRHELNLGTSTFGDGDHLTPFCTVQVVGEVLFEFAHTNVHVYTLSDSVHTSAKMLPAIQIEPSAVPGDR